MLFFSPPLMQTLWRSKMISLAWQPHPDPEEVGKGVPWAEPLEKEQTCSIWKSISTQLYWPSLKGICWLGSVWKTRSHHGLWTIPAQWCELGTNREMGVAGSSRVNSSILWTIQMYVPGVQPTLVPHSPMQIRCLSSNKTSSNLWLKRSHFASLWVIPNFSQLYASSWEREWGKYYNTVVKTYRFVEICSVKASFCLWGGDTYCTWQLAEILGHCLKRGR